MFKKIIAFKEAVVELENYERAVNEVVKALSERPELGSKFIYIRGVAPQEAYDAVRGKNGRVSDEKAITNRGSDKERLAFGLNERYETGISTSLMNEFFLDLQYYANVGAFSEKYGYRDLSPEQKGCFLIFATDKNLTYHDIQLDYGSSWRSTSELPAGIEEKLVAVFPAAQSTGPSSVGKYARASEIVFMSPNVDDNIKHVQHIYAK